MTVRSEVHALASGCDWSILYWFILFYFIFKHPPFATCDTGKDLFFLHIDVIEPYVPAWMPEINRKGQVRDNFSNT